MADVTFDPELSEVAILGLIIVFLAPVYFLVNGEPVKSYGIAFGGGSMAVAAGIIYVIRSARPYVSEALPG